MELVSRAAHAGVVGLVATAMLAFAGVAGAAGTDQATSASAKHHSKKHTTRCKPPKKGTRGHAKRCKAPKPPTSHTPSTTPTATLPPNTSGTPAPAPQQDPTTRFLNMFRNSGWDRQYSANTPQHEPEESLYNFCADNRLYYRFTSPNVSDYINNGTWQLQGVQTGTVQGYNVVEGHVTGATTDQSGSPSTYDLYIDLSEQLPNIALINGNEYQRVSAAAC